MWAVDALKRNFVALGMTEILHDVDSARLDDWNYCTELLRSVMRLLQRHQKTDAQWTNIESTMRDASPEQRLSVLRGVLEFLFRRVHKLTVEVANFRLQTVLAPMIKDSGILYEREKFQGKLDDGVFKLDRTARWLSAVVEQEVRAVGRSEVVHSKEAHARVHMTAVLALVADEGANAIDRESCPETLFMDAHRLRVLQREYRYIVTGMAQLALATFKLMEPESNLRVLEEINSKLVESKSTTAIERLVADFAQMLLGSTLTEDEQKTLTQAMCQCASPLDSVHVHM
jgi:hypothetical protein